jgi:uncharacterized membrane protein
MRAWLLTFHLVGVIMWMGGFMVFARLLAYHAVEPPSARPTLSRIESRLNYFVAVPGAVLATGCGIFLVRQHGLHWLGVALWLHIKSVLVLVLLVAHLGATRAQRRIARLDPNAPIAGRGWRRLHLLVGLVLVAVIALAVQQPMLGGR